MTKESGKNFIEKAFEKVTRITRDTSIVVAGIALFLGKYGVAATAAMAAIIDQVLLDVTKSKKSYAF